MRRYLYLAAVAAFALATLAKGMTLTMPLVLLACAWWQRGRIRGRDLLRVLPYVLIGSIMVGVEVWQQHLAASHTSVRDDGLLSRTAVAGCAVWFYLGKLVWPVDLAFVYPRWDLRAVGPLWFVPGLLLAAIFALSWQWRRSWGRPAMMLIICYVALLLPVLGFVNIYFMEYSLVADHWQYAAMIVPCAAFAAAVGCLKRTRPVDSASGAFHALYALCCLALLATLAVLTWRQSWLYTDVETLYQTTIERNPGCFMAHDNLGQILENRGLINQAMDHYRQALRIKPDDATAHINMGKVLAGCGRFGEAIEHYRRALAAIPNSVTAHYDLANTLADSGRIGEAIEHYRTAIEINPRFAEAHCDLGLTLAGCGRVAEAIDQYRTALEIKPDDAEAHNDLGIALAGRGRLEEAIDQYRKALEIRPDYAEAHVNLGVVLAKCGQTGEAIEHYRRAASLAALQNKPAVAAQARSRLADILRADRSSVRQSDRDSQ